MNVSEKHDFTNDFAGAGFTRSRQPVASATLAAGAGNVFVNAY